MSDEKRRIELQEERDDEALRSLMEAYAEAEGRALQEAAEAQSIPEGALEALDKHVEALLQASEAQQKRLLFRRQAMQTAKRVAVYALIFLLLASTVVMSVSALKIPLMNFFLDDHGRYTTFSLDKSQAGNSEIPLLDWMLQKRPPEGYLLVEKVLGNDDIICLRFENAEGHILQVIVRFSDSVFNVDTEDASQVSVEINGHNAFYLSKKGHRVIWTDENREIVIEVRADGLDENDFWRYVYQLAE